MFVEVREDEGEGNGEEDVPEDKNQTWMGEGEETAFVWVGSHDYFFCFEGSGAVVLFARVF